MAAANDDDWDTLLALADELDDDGGDGAGGGGAAFRPAAETAAQASYQRVSQHASRKVVVHQQAAQPGPSQGAGGSMAAAAAAPAAGGAPAAGAPATAAVTRPHQAAGAGLSAAAPGWSVPLASLNIPGEHARSCVACAAASGFVAAVAALCRSGGVQPRRTTRELPSCSLPYLVHVGASSVARPAAQSVAGGYTESVSGLRVRRAREGLLVTAAGLPGFPRACRWISIATSRCVMKMCAIHHLIQTCPERLSVRGGC